MSSIVNYTIAQLAEVLGVATATVSRKLKRVPYTLVAGKTKPVRTYLVSDLPGEYKKQLEACSHQAQAVGGGLAEAALLTPQQTELAEARLELLLACSGYCRAAGYLKSKQRSKKGEQQYLLALDSESLPAALGRKPSWSTLNRWYKRAEDGLAGLVNNYRSHKAGKTALSAEQENQILSLMSREPSTSVENLRRGLQGLCQDIEVPSCGIIRRWKQRWITNNEELWLYYSNRDAWKNKYMVAYGSASGDVERLNQRWEADSTPADMLLNVDGKLVRYALVGMIDIYSRRLKLLVTPSSTAQAIISLTRSCILDWGVPECIKTDNGKDYVSKRYTQVLRELRIDQKLSKPFSGEEKPHIERAFKTFLHGVFELKPGFIGHSVADRKAIESRKTFASRIMAKKNKEDLNPVELYCTPLELQSFCDEWVEFVYHDSPHRGLNGSSPSSMVKGWQHPIRTIPDIRSLDVLLSPASERQVTKKGIRLYNRYYGAVELAGLGGQQVLVRDDPADLGRVYVYIKGGSRYKYLCQAVNYEWSGENPATHASEAKKHQEKYLRKKTAGLKKVAKKYGAERAHQDFIDLKKSLKPQNVTVLQQKPVSHETRALREAVVSLPTPVKITRPAGVVQLRTPTQQYSELRAGSVGRKLTLSEAEWLTSFYRSVEGAAYRKLEGDLRTLRGIENKKEQNGGE